MYDEIYDNVERVKNILASYGHDSVDETQIFELLQSLKMTDLVDMLLGSRARLLYNSPENCRKLDANLRESEVKDSVYLPNVIDDNSSDVLELTESTVVNKASESKDKFAIRAVDLTLDDRESSPQSSRSPNIEMNGWLKSVQSTDTVEPIIDLTKEGYQSTVGVQEVDCVKELSRDAFESKDDDTDGINFSTDSEVEMDDYYKRPYIESEESDGKSSIPPSPIMRLRNNGVSPSLQSLTNDVSNHESGENQMEEMLEENNNDPNNNLEDIQILGQNNGASATTQNLNLEAEKEDSIPFSHIASTSETRDAEKCSSPKPGCSKDSYYADSDFCIAEKHTFMIRTRPNIENMHMDSDSLDRNCAQDSDTKINQDMLLIQTILPDLQETEILSALIENRDASNRVEIAMWDLLPDHRPLPIFAPKRKQLDDNCPSIVKKFVPHLTYRAQGMDFVVDEEPLKPVNIRPDLPGTKNSNIIKPATLKMTNKRQSILSPPKLMLATSVTCSTLQPTSKLHTPILTPSKLDHLGKQTACSTTSKAITKTSSDCNASQVRSKNIEHLNKGEQTRASDFQTGAIPKKLNAFLEEIQSEAVRKQEIGNTGAIPKDTAQKEGHIPLKKKKKTTQITLKISSQYTEPSHSKHLTSEELQTLPDSTTSNMSKIGAQAASSSSNSNSGESNRILAAKVVAHKSAKVKNKERSTTNSLDIALVKAGIARAELLMRDRQRFRDLATSGHELLEAMVLDDVLALEAEVKLAPQSRELPSNSVANNEAASYVPATIAKKKEQPIGTVKKQQPPKELFNPLINMFPDVDPEYIRQLCVSAIARNQSLESLVDVLLLSGSGYPRIVNPEPEPSALNPDTQYETLQGIFPDAHPEYLRNIAESYYSDPEAMKDFVQTKLETPDYPKMADYLKKIKVTEQILQYTVDFSAEKFLKIFPNPFDHFENPKRIYRYNVIAFEFLKCHFKSNKVATILKAYRSPDHPNHLCLAAKMLETVGADMKSKRIGKEIPTEDIPLLQEFAFIRNKVAIKEFMREQKRKEEEDFKRLKANNELLECQCCYDTECMPVNCLPCSEGHIFCKSCIKLGSESKIGDGQTSFACFVECKGEFTLPVLQSVLEPTMFSILLRKRQEEEVKAAGLEGLVSCPFCHFASIPPPEDKVFKCLNPDCMKETCRLCKELNHVPLRCDEVDKQEEARHYLEEKMTEALVRKCYRCSKPFFKDEGCNKMVCVCGAMTCYICGQPVKDYKHFNAQGGERVDLCPLWSDNNLLNAQTVRVVAEAAEKEILKQNPHLKIDTQSIMPSLPQASKGPHQDIANAHILPVHTRRV